MSFKTLEDFTAIADYERNLKAALKAAASKPAALHFFENFKFASTSGPLILVGPVDSKLVQQVVARGAKLKAKGTVLDGDDRILYNAPGVKPDAFTKALLLAKVKKAVMTGDDEGHDAQADEQDKQEAAELAKQLIERFKPLKERSLKVQGIASGDYKNRIVAQQEEFENQLKAKDWKGAALTVRALQKILDDIETLHENEEKEAAKVVEYKKKIYETNKKQISDQVSELNGRAASFRPPLHEKYVKEVKEKLSSVVTNISDPNKVNWDLAKKVLGDLGERLDWLDNVAEERAELISELGSKQTESRILMTRAKDRLKTADRKLLQELKELQKDSEGHKFPDKLIETKAYDEAIGAHVRLNEWLRKNFPASGGGTGDPLTERMKAFVYNKPSTWELNAVEYKNGTSAGDIGGKAADLANASLSSNTTAGGSVLKTDFEGHAHLDGGSGGVAFVYKLKDDYTVTPTVVDVSSKRGGKNGNQYSWNTGGGWAYFPPNAKY